MIRIFFLIFKVVNIKKKSQKGRGTEPDRKEASGLRTLGCETEKGSSLFLWQRGSLKDKRQMFTTETSKRRKAGKLHPTRAMA